LGSDEVQELLVPTLDALAFLHREKWIQGQLKPSNFLVVNDHLKLAIDTIRPVGVSQVGPRRPSIYEPPESDEGTVAAASDIWALGVTVTEALTQYPPTWLGGRTDPPTFPTNLPAEFADTIQRCLSPNPDERPTVAQLQAKTRPRSAAPAAQPLPPVPPQVVIPPLQQPPLQIADPPPIRAEVRTFSGQDDKPKRSVLVHALIAVAVVGAAIWGGTKLLNGPSAPVEQAAAPESAATSTADGSSQTGATEPPSSTGNTPPLAVDPTATRRQTPTAADQTSTQRQSATTPPPAVTSSPPARAASSSSPPPTARANTPRRPAPAPTATESSGAAVHEEIPKVSAASRSTIHGHVRVAVRVTVDGSGRVVRDNLDNPSSSSYFNRLASEAARKWRFGAADQGSREWLLHFEFGRDGTTVRAVGPRS
jgi:TonB family protein